MFVSCVFTISVVPRTIKPASSKPVPAPYTQRLSMCKGCKKNLHEIQVGDRIPGVSNRVHCHLNGQGLGQVGLPAVLSLCHGLFVWSLDNWKPECDLCTLGRLCCWYNCVSPLSRGQGVWVGSGTPLYILQNVIYTFYQSTQLTLLVL